MASNAEAGFVSKYLNKSGSIDDLRILIINERLPDGKQNELGIVIEQKILEAFKANDKKL